MRNRQAALDPASAPISRLNKGIGHLNSCLSPQQIALLDWNLLREDLSLPVAVLSKSRLRHNAAWMRNFIAAAGVRIAPHGKTTMAPALFQMQLEHGAWGITLATAPQCLVAWEHGVRRILMANQLIGRQNMAIVSSLLHDPGLDFYCLLDSAEHIDQLGAYFAHRGQRLQVLLELGMAGGRNGARSVTQVENCLTALKRWEGVVALCGIELYEGITNEELAIRSFLETAIEVTVWRRCTYSGALRFFCLELDQHGMTLSPKRSLPHASSSP